MTDLGMDTTLENRERQEFSWSWFLLSPKGRICRSDYWIRFVIPYIVGAIVVGALDGLLGTTQPETNLGALSALYILLALYPSIVVAIKRWHDRDKSGWWVLIGLVPIIGAIWIFVECGCLKGTDGPNRFGPPRYNV